MCLTANQIKNFKVNSIILLEVTWIRMNCVLNVNSVGVKGLTSYFKVPIPLFLFEIIKTLHLFVPFAGYQILQNILYCFLVTRLVCMNIQCVNIVIVNMKKKHDLGKGTVFLPFLNHFPNSGLSIFSIFNQ